MRCKRKKPEEGRRNVPRTLSNPAPGGHARAGNPESVLGVGGSTGSWPLASASQPAGSRLIFQTPTRTTAVILTSCGPSGFHNHSLSLSEDADPHRGHTSPAWTQSGFIKQRTEKNPTQTPSVSSPCVGHPAVLRSAQARTHCGEKKAMPTCEKSRGGDSPTLHWQFSRWGPGTNSTGTPGNFSGMHVQAPPQTSWFRVQGAAPGVPTSLQAALTRCEKTRGARWRTSREGERSRGEAREPACASRWSPSLGSSAGALGAAYPRAARPRPRPRPPLTLPGRCAAGAAWACVSASGGTG